MDSDNNNQDNADSVAALKDLTAELESLKASDLAAEAASDASASDASVSETSADDTSDSNASTNDIAETPTEPTVSTEETVAAELPDKPNLEVPSEPIVPDESTPSPAFDPSTLNDTASATEDASAADESTQPIPSDTVADFTEMPANSSDEENKQKEDEEEKNLPPIKPAAPVPGSIGSAKSYEDYQTDEANRANKEADKAAREADRAHKDASTKKTTGTGLILGIVIAAIAVIAAVIFAIMVLTGEKPKQATTPTPAPEPEPAFSSVTCTKPISGAELSALGNATEAEITYTATYYDDELNDLSEKTIITYADATSAQAAAPLLKDAYESTLALINISEDPFDSTYPVSDKTLTITHLADADDITSDNFAIFGLQVNSDGVVETDIDAIEKLYTGKDFTCVVK